MAESDGKIYITISDKRGEGGGGETPTNDPKEKETKGSILGKYAQHQFFGLIKSEANNLVNYTIGNIGNFTGDYRQQRVAQMSVSMLQKTNNLFMSAYAGATLTGSLAGGVIGLAVAGLSMAVNTGLQTYSEWFANKRQNYEISQLRDISGLDTLTNGGR